MITYELAKQLKEAGFEQPLLGVLGCEYKGNYIFEPAPKDAQVIDANAYQKKDGSWGILEDKAYIPTLSELIDACGEDFHWLNKMKDAYEAWFWSAMTLSKKIGQGETPEAAVAKLWLSLNK